MGGLEDHFDENAELDSAGVGLFEQVDLFTSEADLSGIGSALQVDSAIHKAFVEVDEEGTTAAAATAAMRDVTMPKTRPIFFM